MAKRKLRMVKRDNPAIGICEQCNSQFRSSEANEDVAVVEIAEAFSAHSASL